MREPIKLLFEKYLDSVYPDARPAGKGLSSAQYRELKNAFYAAFWSALHEIGELSSKLSESRAVDILSAMEKECKAHAAEVLNRYNKTN
jgi:hypothetical protein